MKKYNITCYLTSKGWQFEHDYAKMLEEPVRMQRDFQKIIDTLAEKMSRRDDTPAQFKIKLTFKPNSDRRSYVQTIDYQQAKYCPTTYSKWGIDLYNILCEEMYK